MATKLITITVSQEDDGDIKCAADFHGNLPVSEAFPIVGQAIDGITQVMARIGQAKGMTQEQCVAAMFPDREPEAAR